MTFKEAMGIVIDLAEENVASDMRLFLPNHVQEARDLQKEALDIVNLRFHLVPFNAARTRAAEERWAKKQVDEV